MTAPANVAPLKRKLRRLLIPLLPVRMGVPPREPREGYAAERRPHSSRVAIRAPSARDLSLAHMMLGWTRCANGDCAKPQSVPPMTFSLTDDLGKPDNALRHQLRMFDNVGGVADDSGNQHLAGRELDRSPDHPFVLVARIGGLELIGAHVHLQHEIDDVLHRHVEGMRAVPAAPADVIARAFRRDAPERVVEGVDAHLRPRAILRVGHWGHHLFVHVR